MTDLRVACDDIDVRTIGVVDELGEGDDGCERIGDLKT